MNNFDPKYMKLSAKYLQEKLDLVESKVKNIYVVEKKKESKIHRLLNILFKS